MGYDQVTWNPRISASGDDKYNFPGAIRMSGVQDSSDAPAIEAGDASDFDTIPSIAQLNASSGINQIIGLINRRCIQAGLAPAPYVSAENIIQNEDISGLRAKIQALRTVEGWTASASFSAALPSQDATYLGAYCAELRRALGLYGSFIPPIDFHDYVVYDVPLGTMVSQTIYTNQTASPNPLAARTVWSSYLSPTATGVNGAPPGNWYIKTRTIWAFHIPEWANQVTSAPMGAGAQQYGYLFNGSVPFTHLTYLQASSSAPISAADFLPGSLLFSFTRGAGSDNVVANVDLKSVVESAAGSQVRILHGFQQDFGASSDASLTAQRLVVPGSLVVNM